jgi:tRNA G10  N-methylase Trm11
MLSSNSAGTDPPYGVHARAIKSEKIADCVVRKRQPTNTEAWRSRTELTTDTLKRHSQRLTAVTRRRGVAISPMPQYNEDSKRRSKEEVILSSDLGLAVLSSLFWIAVC